MIRFGRIFDPASPAERRKLAEAKELFRRIFPLEPEYAERIERLLRERATLGFDLAIITAESARGRIVGLAVVYFFPAIRYGFLDYIGSGPERRRRGIGLALYEAVREYLANKGARGLFLEIPPDDPQRMRDRSKLRERRERAKFYERFGALPILGTIWESPPTPPADYDPPYLVFDGLGRPQGLPREHARKAAREILRARYGRSGDDPEVIAIAHSFRDDPVRLRPARYEKPASDALAGDPVSEQAARSGGAMAEPAGGGRATEDAPSRAATVRERTWTPESRRSPGQPAEVGRATGLRPAGGRIRPIHVLVPEHHEIHHVRERGYVERPARVRAILKAMRELPIEFRPVPRAGDGPIRAVHDPDFVAYLRQATRQLDEQETIYPQVFPIRRPERKPREMPIRAGYYCCDTFTPLSRSAYTAARSAADCAVAGARLLQGGEHLVYAICRPPGHHAERRIYGGFCYFNNAAIAAQIVSTGGKVALLDIDYHHGNGQQDIFYERADVLTISIHGHPRDHYPYFAGYADERGAGPGAGFNRNYIVKDLAGDAAYQQVLAKALHDIRRFEPMWLVVALGYDTMAGDPTGNFNLTSTGMRRIGQALAHLRLPTLVVQEGGYTLRNLGIGARAFFSGLSAGWFE